ncbi:polyprenyl synthetase family protein [Nocardia abscessus]|uniref:polyprenyl synthetase family protein n=1 Tax=Nocardia TaxID=1817 RepID=UPI001894D3B0|nr:MULTISPECIES: polyprenyl synthetase family protein [Nocardia]MBF6221529.1 polyprenyl synthetase family protein [Nocardia abscessus]MDE1674076.1 polyprenyl synthetase family protein [Nocardia gipuzkoensis]
MTIVSPGSPAADLAGGIPVLEAGDSFPQWRAAVRRAVLEEIHAFLLRECPAALRRLGAPDVLRQYAMGGKCLRSTFMYLGWLCGAPGDPAALRAAASLELLHAFALLQDDVMDQSATRRAAPAAHVRFAALHRGAGAPGSSTRYGESAAILLGDMCLVWAEQMLRESGCSEAALRPVWPRYDAMRLELATGQFADLLNDARTEPTLASVLAIARAKSGNYTVRRPLEMGAALAGCDAAVLEALGRYGTAVGEAFQLRDDVLGIFGSQPVTGKPADGDLAERTATTVVVLARQMATSSARTELAELLSRPRLGAEELDRARTLIVESGAPAKAETMIAELVARAQSALDSANLTAPLRAALGSMATACTERVA